MLPVEILLKLTQYITPTPLRQQPQFNLRHNIVSITTTVLCLTETVEFIH